MLLRTALFTPALVSRHASGRAWFWKENRDVDVEVKVKHVELGSPLSSNFFLGTAFGEASVVGFQWDPSLTPQWDPSLTPQ